MKSNQSEVEAITEAFVAKMRQLIQLQTEYDFKNNIPQFKDYANKTSEEIARHVLGIAVASTVGNYNKYDISKSGEFAVEILEGVNAHSEAEQLQKLLYTE